MAITHRMLITLMLTTPLAAHAAIEGDFEFERAGASTTWFGPADPAAKQADLDYLAGMKPHHAGALSMSGEYLADPAASSPLLRQLARTIIANQRFEVDLLDEVSVNLAKPPVVLPFGIRLQPMATEGVAQARLFLHTPIPGRFTYRMGPISTRDVQFAKAMIIHHQGALDMARAYHGNAAARNGFLGLFNVDVVTDQSAEIGLMRSVIAAYPGDADAVVVNSSMVHGMGGMMHGAGHMMGHGSQDSRPAAQTAPAERTDARPAARPAKRTPAKAAVDHSGHEGHDMTH